MVNLTSRKDAFENKFAHDEMLRFKSGCPPKQAVRIVGCRTAREVGYRSGRLRQVGCNGRLRGIGDEDVVRKILRDFEAAGDAKTESEVRRVLDELSLRAMDEIKSAV